MTLPPAWNDVTPQHVLRAIDEFDTLGAQAFFAAHGFAPATTYELIHAGNTYPPKAILGTAHEFATGRRLDSAQFEGGKSGAVRILTRLGFTVRPIQRPASR